MKDRTLYILAGVFFLCAGMVFLAGLRTDASMGAVMDTPAPAHVSPATSSGAGAVSIGSLSQVNWIDILYRIGRVVLLFLIYFLPAFNASERKHRERKAILTLNLLLGWTVIGWIAALVWSFTSQVDQPSTTQPSTP